MDGHGRGQIQQREQQPLLDDRNSRTNIRNVIVLGVGFFFVFMGFNTAQTFAPKILQHHQLHELGFYSLTVLYLVSAVTVFASPLVVQTLGIRWTFAVSGLCALMFTASFIKPYAAIVYTGAALFGLTSGFLWVAQGFFLALNTSAEHQGRNAGVFWAIFQCSGIVGNLMSYFIFRAVSVAQYTWLFVGLSASVVIGTLILFFVGHGEKEAQEAAPSIARQLLSSFALLKSRNALLFLPVFFFTGFSLAYVGSEFPFLIPTPLVGLVLTCWGAAEVLGGLFSGKLADVLGRRLVLALAMVCYALGLGGSWYLRARPTQLWIAYVTAALFGLSDSSTNVVVYSSIQRLWGYKEKSGVSDTKAAFSLFEFVQVIGSGK